MVHDRLCDHNFRTRGWIVYGYPRITLEAQLLNASPELAPNMLGFQHT